MKKKNFQVLILHGPNMNLLGEREPEIYGTMTLIQMNKKLKTEAEKRKLTVKIFQSNGEGKLIDLLHQFRHWAHGVIINPGAYTHYSYAIRDAVASINIPTIEVHLSDIHSREDFRKISVIAPVCRSQVAGLGWQSYTKAMDILLAEEKNGG